MIGARFAFIAFAFCSAACDGQFRFDDSTDAAASTSVDAGDSGRPDQDGSAPATGCTSDADCKLTDLHCDLVSHSCVACLSDSYCSAPHPRCDAALHQCIECGTDSDCGAGQKCEPTTRHCVTTCSSLIGNGCPGETPVCDTSTGLCYRCTSSVECTFSDQDTVCDTSDRRCVGCLTDGQCPGSKPRCDSVSQECVRCLSASDCPASTPLCEPKTLTCVSG